MSVSTNQPEPFRLFFQGAEQPGWRELLLNAGVEHLGVGFSHFKRKIAKRNWVFPRLDATVLLDSGGHSANKNPEQMDRDGWLAYADAYFEFIRLNQESFEYVVEFDAQVLGAEYIADVRRIFSEIVGEKLVVVWHSTYGLDVLEEMCASYRNVAVPEREMAQSEVPQRLNSLIRTYGTHVHGLACSKPDVLRDVSLASASSTSWLSPTQFGDVICWDGNKLHRYPKKYKEVARQRHKNVFTRAGFSAEKILRDDPEEITRFTIWSWLRFEEALNRQRGVTPLAPVVPLPTMERFEGTVGAPPRTDEHRPLPVLSFAAGLPVIEKGPIRCCTNCYVASNCPAFKPASKCAFSLPVTLQSREEMLSFLRAIIEMQGMRVMFGRFAEELEGGYPDPNISNEIDRFMRLVKELRDIEDNRDSLKLSMEARAGAGILSRLFGRAPGPIPIEVPQLESDR